MAFTEAWVETDPDGSIITVSQLDNFERATKRQLRERLEGDPANLNLSGVFESTGGGFSSAAVVKKGAARAFVDTIANIGLYPLQDGRIFIASDTGRTYHLKGSGAVEYQYLPLTGGTVTGDIVLSATASSRILAITANAGQSRILSFRTGAQNRWIVSANATAEGGANAGSDLAINRYDDAGTLLGTPVTLTRSSGLVAFANSVTVGTNLTVTGTTLATGDLTAGARLLFSTAAGKIIPGATTLSIRNNADSADNILITDAGTVAIFSQLTVKSNIVADRTGAALDINIVVRGDAGKNRGLIFGTGALTRWYWAAGTGAEGGANAGSDLALTRYDDAGVALATVLSIVRSTGGVTIASGLTISASGITITSGGISMTGDLVLNTAASRIRPGATSLSIRNNANNKDNILVTENGQVTIAGDTGTPMLILTRTEGAAGLNTYIVLQRSAVTKSRIGLDNSDNFCIQDSSGAAARLTVDGNGTVTIGNSVTASHALHVDLNVAAGTYNGLIALQRQATTRAFIALDANDSLSFVDSTGASGNLVITNAGSVSARVGYRVANAAATGQYIRGNGTDGVFSALLAGDLPVMDSVRAYRTSSIDLAQNTLTAIGFDGEDFDTNSMHDTVTNNSRLTAQTAGKYKVTAHIQFTGTASNVFIVIRKNGVATNLGRSDLNVTGTATGTLEINMTLSLSASDYVEVYGQTDVVANPDIQAGSERTYFEMAKLSN